MSTQMIRISIFNNDSKKHYNILKILPYSDGGFGIILPRLKDTLMQGRLEKMHITYKKSGNRIHMKHDETEQYKANDIVKFSYHNDGFTQFSSTTNTKIISGKDQDGSPKGLGVQSWSLIRPISTGPSMAMSIWGIDKFSEEKSKNVNPRYVFNTDSANLISDNTFGDGPSYIYAFEIFVLLAEVNEKSIVKVNGKEYADIVYYQTELNRIPQITQSVRTLVRIIRLPNKSIVLGLSWKKFYTNGTKSTVTEQGYNFLGPSDTKRFLMATYPIEAATASVLMKSLNYTL